MSDQVSLRPFTSSWLVGGFTTFQLVFRTLLRFVLTNCMS